VLSIQNTLPENRSPLLPSYSYNRDIVKTTFFGVSGAAAALDICAMIHGNEQPDYCTPKNQHTHIFSPLFTKILPS